MEPDRDDYYMSDEERSDDLYNSDDTPMEYDFMESENGDSDDNDFTLNKHESYTILNEEDVLKRQEDHILKVTSILSVSREEAILMLLHYNWNVDDLHEAWFADEENVRKAAGLTDASSVAVVAVLADHVQETSCGICFDNFTFDEMKSLVCGHLFCVTCWECYISTSINDGPGCLTLRCPTPKCGVAVGENMIKTFASESDFQKYKRYVVKSYIEGNKKIKWCPAPDCQAAVEFVVGSGIYDVSCHCSYSFCWNCTTEVHRPVDCATVDKWNHKNNNEAENANWILAFTKPCPKCKRPIEKNNGCMHMTCRAPCGHEFCWTCLRDYKGHGTCNRYEGKTTNKASDEAEQRRQRAKDMLERYMHYYERWFANHSSREKARSDLEEMRSVHLSTLGLRHCQTDEQLKFIIEAWLQIIECRRVLKWTYAYGYYFPEHETTKKQFFEYLQGEAEAGLERLHLCAEKELEFYLKEGEGLGEDFNEYRTKLIRLTIATRTYFENLVKALENGLADVDSQESPGKNKDLGESNEKSKKAEGKSSRKKKKIKIEGKRKRASKTEGSSTNRDVHIVSSDDDLDS